MRSDRALIRHFVFFLLIRALFFIHPAWADPPAQEAGQAAIKADPLERETPKGAVLGFLKAVQFGKHQTATQYLQLRGSRQQAKGERLADELAALLNHALVGGVPILNPKPEGNPEDGLALDRERIGRIAGDGLEADVELVRVDDPDAGKIWLFSTETLAKVPGIYSRFEKAQKESEGPKSFLDAEYFDVTVSKWLKLLAGLPASAALGWLLAFLIVLPLKLWRRFRKRGIVNHWAWVPGPVWLILGVAVNFVVLAYLHLPPLRLYHYEVLLALALAVGIAWLLLRLTVWIMEGLRHRVTVLGRPELGSLIMLGQRLIKALIIASAGLAILKMLGLDMSTALAGLGIGGLAFSFGAQKTVENLFGGVSVLGDDVIRVGDFCRIGDRLGTVEDISMRSTRLRTIDRTELSVPNGNLAASNVENFRHRDKILFNPVLGLRYETGPDQMRQVLADIRGLLYRHPMVETETARARFADFGESALSVEIFSYIRTRDYAQFTAVREDLLLRIMEIVAESGTGFAFPSRTVYLGKDTGLDRELADAASRKTRRQRDEQRMPFPDFAPTDIAAMRDSLDYPPPESAAANRP